MRDVVVRRARPEDAPFLALAMQEADRGHTGVGSWDVMFPGEDAARLAHLAELAGASQPSFVHWSTFLVAELDGARAGAAAGYVPAATTAEQFARACDEVLGADAEAKLARRLAWSAGYFSVEIPAQTLRVEWVYTDPEARGRGISSRLVAALLVDATERGLVTAHVAAYVGNEAALATYRRVGFREFARCLHVDYEQRFATPGLVFLRRDLS